MSFIQMDKGRVKIGKYSLSNLALAEAGSAGAFFVLTIVIGWSAFLDYRCSSAWSEALVLYGGKQTDKALVETEKAISARPEFPPPHELKAKIAADGNDFGTAREEYEKLLKLDPTIESSRIGFGVLLLKEWDQKKNEALLKQAKVEFSEVSSNPDAQIGLGHMNLRLGDLTGAEKNFTEAERSETPPSVDGLLDLYIGQGYLGFRRQQFTKARECYERTRLLDTSWDIPLANRAYMLSRQMAGMDLTREKFDTLSIDWQEFLETLAGIYNTDPGGKAFLKPAMVDMLDSWGCLAIRSVRLGHATNKLLSVRGLDANAKRPTLNFIATMTGMLYSSAMVEEERRQFTSQLEEIINTAPVLHKDLTARERCVLQQILCVKYLIDAMNFAAGKEAADRALDLYDQNGIQEPNLRSQILRARAISWFMLREIEQNEEARNTDLEEAKKNAEESNAIEPQEDLEHWIKALKTMK